MNEFNELEEELRKLDEDFQSDSGDDILRHLVSPSAADYWKKRLEEEKTLWTRIAEGKDKEKKETESKLNKSQTELEALTERIRELELSLQKEVLSWQERLKSREAEIQLERERTDFSGKIRDLEQQNRDLTSEIARAKEQTENSKQQVESVHQAQIRELLEAQNTVVEAIESAQADMAHFEILISKQEVEITGYKENIKQLVDKSFSLEKEITELNKKIEQKNIEIYEREKEAAEYFGSVVEFFTGKIKASLGTVLGLVNFCFKKLRLGFLSENITIKKQLVVLENIVSEIFSSLERLLLASKREKLNLQQISIERLLTKLHEDIETSVLPAGLTVKADIVKIVRHLKRYCDASTAMVVKYMPAGNETQLKLIIPGKIEIDDNLIQLKYVAYLHSWKVVSDTVEKNTVITLFIRG